MPAPGNPPPCKQLRKLMWVRGVVCRSTQTQTLNVVACVILQCIPCFYECRCMSDGVFIQFVCRVFNLRVIIQIKVCQRFICVVFVNSPHNSTRIMWSLTSPYPSLFRLAISMLCCVFAFWSWGSGLVSSQNLSLVSLVWITKASSLAWLLNL